MQVNNVDITFETNKDRHFSVLQPEDDDIFLDIGAHDGLVALKASKLAKDLKLLLIEPNPVHYPYIHKNLQGLDFTIIPYAAGLTKESTKFHIFSVDGKGGSFLQKYIHRQTPEPLDTIDVTIDTVDNLIGSSYPDFVKVDVEGWGMYVLAGFTKIKPGTKFHFEYHWNLPSIIATFLIKNIKIIKIELWEEFTGNTGAIHGIAL